MENMHKARDENVVAVLGWTRVENVVGIVMEYMPHGSLASLIFKNVPLSSLLRFRMNRDIACGIAHLHTLGTEKRLVHGDIKLENILLSGSLHCKIADFGGARLAPYSGSEYQSVSSSSTDEKNQYTCLYAAPEVLNNPFCKKRRAHDVYSFSVIATELIGWERPALHRIDLCIESVKKGERPELDDINLVETIFKDGTENEKNIFKKLIDVIKNCRKHTSSERPQMTEVKNDLEEFWNKCDITRIQCDVKEVLDQISPGIDKDKENYSLKTLTNFVSLVFQLSIPPQSGM